MSLLKQYILFYGNGLGIWHCFPDIMHIKVNNGGKSAILNFYLDEIFHALSLPEATHFVLWWWSSYMFQTRFPDNTHIKLQFWKQVGHFKFDQVEIFQGIYLPDTTQLYYSNGLDS